MFSSLIKILKSGFQILWLEWLKEVENTMKDLLEDYIQYMIIFMLYIFKIVLLVPFVSVNSFIRPQWLDEKHFCFLFFKAQSQSQSISGWIRRLNKTSIVAVRFYPSTFYCKMICKECLVHGTAHKQYFNNTITLYITNNDGIINLLLWLVEINIA